MRWRMVGGRIAEYGAPRQCYRLPEEHANWLARQSEDGNIAVFMQYDAMTGTVADELVACFEQPGGVP